ncbi:MAG: GIY-YIG nuclease family protein [Pikeienuella sp.]
MWVYILANRRNGTIYTGVTNDLVRRIHQHRTRAVPSFTKRYDVTSLVWFTEYGDPETAIKREKAIKSWPRKWKLALIEKENPEWRDMWNDISEP